VLAVDLVESLFGKSTLMRQPDRRGSARDLVARPVERPIRH
jgi:hypothetical protein